MYLLVASILWGSCNSLFTLIEKTNSRHKNISSNPFISVLTPYGSYRPKKKQREFILLVHEFTRIVIDQGR